MRRQDKNHRKVRKCKSGPNFTGQHLLHNPATIRHMIEMARLQPTDTILEIGAGKGALTLPLAHKVRSVIAVEVDADFTETLRTKTQHYPHVKIIHGDIRNIRLPSRPFSVVANIPFSITTPILVKLLGAEGQHFQKGTLLLEKGAARRFAVDPTTDPRLLMWRMLFQFDLARVVPRAHFAPPPRVDAAIVTVIRRERPLVSFKDGSRFAAFAAYILREPRLGAADSLRGIFTPAQIKFALRDARAERDQTVASLSLGQWAVLFRAMLGHVEPYRWPGR